MERPSCFGGHDAQSLKCFECASNFYCLKERERELRFKQRQKENAEALIDYIQHYSEYQPKRIPKLIMDRRGRVYER